MALMRKSLVVSTLLAALLVTCAAFYPHRFRVSAIGVLPNRTASFASAVNNRGVVVGASFSDSLPFRAFRWRNGKMRDLGTLGGTYSAARSINDFGQIVGESKILGDTTQHAFLWDDGQMTDLGTLGGEQSEAYGINNRSQIVGWSWDAVVSLPKAVIWERGAIRPLPTPSEVVLSFASGINDKSMISGTAIHDGNPTAVRWVDGVMSYLGDLGGGRSYGNAINERGDVVGWAMNAEGQQRAFLWRNGSMIDLGLLPNGTSAVALGVNDVPEVAMSVAVEGRDHAVLWRKGRLIDLGTAVRRSPSPLYGVAYSVNERGQVTFTTDANDAYLLTPLDRHFFKSHGH